MRKIATTLSRYPLSLLCVALIWILCFCTPPQTPLDGVPMMDKWTHLVMYGGTCAVIWVEFLHSHAWRADSRRLFRYAWLAPVLMSGLIELLQAYCTGGRRSGDWMDFLANSVGATLGAAVGYCIYRLRK